MTQAGETRTRIVERASQLMTQHGFNGFSYRDISEPLGVKNAAIHYHFPSKTDLVRALIEDQHDMLRRFTSKFMAYGGSAREQLEGLFLYTLEQCRNGRPVCIVGALAADYDEFPEEIKQANRCFLEDSHGWLERVVELGREQGEFDFPGDPESKAETIAAALQGGRQLFRARGEDFLNRLFARIRLDLGIEA